MLTQENLYLDGEEQFGPFLSAFYSRFTAIATSRYHREIADDILRSGTSKVLDIGCGPADVLSILSAKDGKIELYGVDPSSNMVSIARRNLRKKASSSRFRIELGSSRSIPFRLRFDRIISSFSFHHWRNRYESLPYLLDFLTPTGTMSFYELNSESYPGSLPLIRKHAIGREIVDEINIRGIAANTELSRNGRLLILRIRHDTM